MLFSVSAKTLQMVHERMEDGCVYQVAPFNGKLVASINSKVSVSAYLDLPVSFPDFPSLILRLP